MQTSRRGFLTGLVGLSAVALATKLALPSTMMAEEVREELIKDLRAPQRTIFDMRDVSLPVEPVWASVSATADYWAKSILADMQKRLRVEEFMELNKASVLRHGLSPAAQLPSMARKLAQQIDADLREQQVSVAKQLVIGMPKWDIVRSFGAPTIEIRAGLSKHQTIWGDEYRVEHIRPTDLIIPGLDKRGQAEYGGLILPS